MLKAHFWWPCLDFTGETIKLHISLIKDFYWKVLNSTGKNFQVLIHQLLGIRLS